jgi:hypothetical protein
MRRFIISITLVIFSSFVRIDTQQVDDILYFIKDKGLYIHYDEVDKRKKVPYKENWDFYFSLKNDTTAVIQDIRKGIVQSSKYYKVTAAVNTVFIKTYKSGSIKVEKAYYKTVY